MPVGYVTQRQALENTRSKVKKWEHLRMLHYTQIDWLTNWLTDWLLDWLTDQLTDRLNDWLFGGLTGWIITKRAKSKNRMQIIGTSRESDDIIVFWEKWEKNERQFFILKIVLGTLAYALEKVSNLPPFRFVCLSLSKLWRHSRASLLVIWLIYWLTYGLVDWWNELLSEWETATTADLRSPGFAEFFGHSTLPFCRGRQRNVPKFIRHEHSHWPLINRLISSRPHYKPKKFEKATITGNFGFALG